MFRKVGPKFVEAVGVQLICPYCERKFRAPQGLVAHKHMHERAGHVIGRPRKLSFKRPPSFAPRIRLPPPKQEVPRADKKDDTPPPSYSVKENPKAAPSLKQAMMTRRFSVAEKLKIIDKAKEMNNISATCRWVQETFHRKTFARKSLSDMLAREDIFRESSGTKKIRKTIRQKTGLFPRMERKLASWVRETRKVGIPVES